MKKILLIESSGAPVLVERYKRIKELGYQLVVARHNLDNNEEAERLVDHLIPVYTHNFENMHETVSVILQESKKLKVDGVMSRWDAGIPIMVAVSQQLGLSTIPMNSAKILRYKHEMRSFFKEKGIPSAKYSMVCNLREAIRATAEIGYPVVLKPSLGYGSWGVTKINSRQELEEKFEKILRLSIKEFSSDQLLIEEYLQGTELTVDSIVYKGEVIFSNICEKPTIDSTYGFAEVDFITPPGFSEKEVNEIYSVNRMIVEKLGITNAVLHVEMRLTAEGPKILEVNPRIGGARIIEITRIARNVDLELAAIHLAFNEKPEFEDRYETFCGFRIIYPTETGILREVSGLEEARSIPNVIEVTFNKEQGKMVYTLPYFIQDQLGYIVAKGKNRNQVLQALSNASECIRLEVSTKGS